jgi:hypothetical protein
VIRVVIALGLVVSALGVLGAAHADAQLPAKATVVDSECNGRGAVSGEREIATVRLRVTFAASEPVVVHPHTWDQKRHVQHAWEPRNVTLQPGTQTVTLRAPSREARLTPGVRAQIALNDGQRRAVTNWEARRCGA